MLEETDALLCLPRHATPSAPAQPPHDAAACRYAAGALSLASPEVKFKLDAETNSPLDVGMYELRETNMMVEEMMLMANITVATHIHKAFASCAVLRRHETPTPEMFKPLLQVRSAPASEHASPHSTPLLGACLSSEHASHQSMPRLEARPAAEQASPHSTPP